VILGVLFAGVGGGLREGLLRGRELVLLLVQYLIDR